MKNEKYILALDLSMSNTGVCVFDFAGELIEVLSISTKSKDTHGERLKVIADELIKIREKYNIEIVAIERGFTRYNKSTQCLYKCNGIANYVFYDKETVYYPPSTIKKEICGAGNVNKETLSEQIKDLYPYIEFSNLDESDAAGVGHLYLMRNNLIGGS